MATFSYKFPRAAHVLPLHALKGILEERALLSKRELVRSPTGTVRATTSLTDAVLGLSDYVHFYLLAQGASWKRLPILATQLLDGRSDPFPHLVLEMPTSPLGDDQCTLCLWNLAVSRPAVPGVCKGGNWTRGTNPDRILEVWGAFRATAPEIARARGYFNEPIHVPTLRGSQIVERSTLLSRAASGIPELLLPAPVAVDDSFTLWVFSDDDMATIATLQQTWRGLRVRRHPLEGYRAQAAATQAWRAQIGAYFAGRTEFPKGLDFDGRR